MGYLDVHFVKNTIKSSGNLQNLKIFGKVRFFLTVHLYVYVCVCGLEPYVLLSFKMRLQGIIEHTSISLVNALERDPLLGESVVLEAGRKRAKKLF